MLATQTNPMSAETERPLLPAPRLLPCDARVREPLGAYRASGGYHERISGLAPAALLTELEASGLRGRGGAGFPAARKWASVAAQRGRAVVVVNASESEPASTKDRLLLAARPHLVIEGALIAARAVGADEIVWYLHTGERAPLAALEAARRELRAAGVRLPRWRVVEAPARYVSGEETAAIERINGGRALPAFKPPRPFERGVRGRPTLVQNVETLANIPGIMRHGSGWFRALGVDDDPGTRLVTLSGSVRWPGVYEAPTGTPLATIVHELGGGTDDGLPVQALLPGGYASGWLPGSALAAGATLDHASLRQWGASPGCGAVSVVSQGVCGLAQAARLLRFFAGESARQCGSCLHGTTAMADALDRVATGVPRPDDLARLDHWARVALPGRGACGHLDGAALAARSALAVFTTEIGWHAKHGGCGRRASIVLPGLRDGASDDRH